MNFIRKFFLSWKENALLNRMIRNAGFLLTSNSLVTALSMFQSAVAARILDVSGFGLLGIITTFATAINKLVSFRMGELVIRFVSQHQEDGDHQVAAGVFKLAALFEMLASLAAFGLIWLLSPIGAQYFAKDAGLASWFTLYGLTVVVNLFTESSTGLLQFFDRFRRMAAVNVVQSLVTLALILVVWWQGGGLLEVLLAYLAGKAVNAAGLAVSAFREARRHWGSGWWRTPLSVLRPLLGDLVRFAVSTNISATLSVINKDSELLWVSFFTSPVEAGYYKVALALANFMQIPVSPLPQATYPELSRAAARRDWQQLRYILKQGSRLAGLYTLAAGIGLAGLGGLLIRWIYTADFLPAYTGLVILTVGFLVANSLYWARTALLSLNLPHYATYINILVTVLKVVGVVLMLPRIGYLGAAIMLAVSHALGTSLSAWKAHDEIRKRERLDAAAMGPSA